MTQAANAITAALRFPRVGIGLGAIALVGLVVVGALAARAGSRRSPQG